MTTSGPINLAIVSDAIYPYNKGGKEVRIHELSTRLAAAGHNVTVYTMKWWDGPNGRIEDGVTLRAISKNYPLYAGERRSILQGILFGFACLKLIFADFDIIDVDHMPFFPLFSVKIASLIRRKPMYATWHEVWGHSYWRTYLGWKGTMAYAVERISTALPSKIVAVSGLTATQLKNQMNVTSPIRIVSNGIDLHSITRVKPSRRSSDLIYVGRLLEHKRVDLLIKAAAILKLTQPAISCIIVGDGPERARLEKLSRESGLQNNIRFTGFLPSHAEKFALMKSSKVFVSPSVREGFGISVLEANACGLPVVVSAHPQNAASELVTEQNGRLSQVSPQAIAHEIEGLLTRPLPVTGIQKTASTYDWDHAAAAMMEVYGL